jgi:DNA-binding NarL/FixJ family response regulator
VSATPEKEMALTNCVRTRILLADDDLQMLVKIDKLLEPDFDVVERVSDGCALVEAALRFRPDVVVTDISMPRLNGLEAVRQIRGSLPGTKCIFLTLHDGNDYRLEAEAAGGEAYVLKSAARRELNKAIQRVTGRST